MSNDSVEVTNGTVVPADQSKWADAVKKATNMLMQAGTAGVVTTKEIAHLASQLYHSKGGTYVRHVAEKAVKGALSEGWKAAKEGLELGGDVAEAAV